MVPKMLFWQAFSNIIQQGANGIGTGLRCIQSLYFAVLLVVYLARWHLVGALGALLIASNVSWWQRLSHLALLHICFVRSCTRRRIRQFYSQPTVPQIDNHGQACVRVALTSFDGAVRLEWPVRHVSHYSILVRDFLDQNRNKPWTSHQANVWLNCLHHHHHLLPPFRENHL